VHQPPVLRRLPARAVIAITVALLACAVAISLIADRLQREAAITHLGTQVAATTVGSSINLAEAFDLKWDRAAVLGAYESGGSANALLGFHAYGEHDQLTVSDENQWLVFARGGSVVADFLIPATRSSFSFEETNVALSPMDATFTVHWRDHTAVLVK
jgi:hypothetical protein